MAEWDYSVDFLVVGSGGGGMAAAITAAEFGGRALVIEKGSCYGGSTALSGGVIWIPNNHHMAASGISDSSAEAMNYLRAVTRGEVAESRLRAYVERGREMLQFLEQRNAVRFEAAPKYMDYYPHQPGAKTGARSLDPAPFSRRQLGDIAAQLQPQTHGSVLNRFSLTAREAHCVLDFNWKSKLLLAWRLFTYYLDVPARLRGLPDNRMTLGQGLVGRLRHAMAERSIPLWLDSAAQELIVEDGRVAGVIVQRDGRQLRVRAERGVLLAAGGFAHNAEMRRAHHPAPTGSEWTAAHKLNTGDGIRMAQRIGAAVEFMNCAWWTPTMKFPDGSVQALIIGKSMPGSIFVGKNGQRFTNEAAPYEDVVKGQYAAHSESSPTIPCYMICDARFRRSYPLGPIGPSTVQPDALIPDQLKKANFVKKGSTLRELAAVLGIDADGLAQAVSRHNEFARTGQDLDFGRGDSAQDRYYSDHTIAPNPCLAPIVEGPFYALEIFPGDLGTKGGLKCDAAARVLAENGAPIEGLYAAGNCSGAVMGNSYPGAGSTIGPSMTFGYLAARHAMGAENGQRKEAQAHG